MAHPKVDQLTLRVVATRGVDRDATTFLTDCQARGCSKRTIGFCRDELRYTSDRLADAAHRLGVALTWEPTPADHLGACDPRGARIRMGTHDPAVFFHQLAHAAQARLNGSLKGGQHTDQEVAAEFTACVLLDVYGLGDRSGNAWLCIQSYASDPIQ